MNKELDRLSRDELLELIEIYAKEWLAVDGLWFQAVEKKRGMDEAMEHDKEMWAQFTVIEANRIKKFLGLPDHPGLEGLEAALKLRLYSNINQQEYIREDNKLVFKTLDCRVQTARSRKGMEWHPCKPVGEIEYSGFARTIDDRISCRCISCYPEITDSSCGCIWEFSLNQL
ncbi:MAG: DUF6125 family protein [Bacillota bacterium]|nr:DUF6125 family protein [Bacillota bacterium]